MTLKKTAKEVIGFFYYNLYKKYKTINGNRSLMYHAFGSKLKHDTYGISIDIKKFKNHINFLYDNYKIIHAHQYTSYKLESISITIDDGYKDTLNAVDILNDKKIPFSLFITTNFINKNNYLSKNDIIQISKLQNSEIGSHGYNHLRLGTLSYKNQLNELSKSKSILEDITSKKILGISYPHGSFNHDTFTILEKLNYKHAFSSIKGINNTSSNKYLIKRNEIISSDDVNSLRKKINGFYDYY